MINKIFQNVQFIFLKPVLKNRLFRLLSTRVNSFTWRTHTCGELSAKDSGETVTLCGWITFCRMDKFLILRDIYGQTQIVLKDSESLTKKFMCSLPLESVIQVKGIVKIRPSKDVNKKLSTGEIEVEASDIQVLNMCKDKLPVSYKDQGKIIESTDYKYRYLSLRSPKLQENLQRKSMFLMKIRNFLHEMHGFIDIETPTLFKKTPGGAKEFIVPSRFPGKFYSLTQSPQQFKQLLMVSGFDRYFQIARCYRNEGTKSDRQPEFTQVDIEMSFTNSNAIQDLIEQMLSYSWPQDKKSFKIPFPRMTYDEAIRTYGTDKPDLRYDWKIQDITDELKMTDLILSAKCKENQDFITPCLRIPQGGSKALKNSTIKELEKYSTSLSVTLIPITIKEDLSWTSSLSKHLSIGFQQKISNKMLSKPEDLILLAAGKSLNAYSTLGKARMRCAEQLNVIKSELFTFLWVTDFPLFFMNEAGRFESAHHPFTSPVNEDIDLIYSDPLKVRSQHYDLVLNGQEIGGGSIRIHDDIMQNYILHNILKEDSKQLQHLLDALGSGCPPHGGIALGIDRIMSTICGSSSITDVMAFPKSLDGKDLMSGAPCSISEEEKLLYHIKTINS